MPLTFGVVVAILVLTTTGCGSDTADTRSETAGLPDVQQEIEAEAWELDPSDSSIELPDGAEATFAVEGDTASGVGPCNAYAGRFALDDHSVAIGPLAGTLIACEQPLMDAQDAFMAALEKVDTLELPDDRLLLTGPDDVRLAFEAQDRRSAILGAWNVVQVATTDAVTGVVDGSGPMLTFSESGDVAVVTGCNDGGAGWELAGGQLTFDPGFFTVASCLDGLNQQEADVRAALEETSGFALTRDSLTLLRADGTITLVATRAEP